jgi:hypothetical protein
LHEREGPEHREVRPSDQQRPPHRLRVLHGASLTPARGRKLRGPCDDRREVVRRCG